MATSSKRVLWKGAISFGLVHIPVALHSATEEKGLDFDWLDKRTMDPVGYKRINKKTGKEIDAENIVKGIEYEAGRYVIVAPEEIAAAYPKTTQSIDIETFVPAASIPFVYFERPYYISPLGKAAKVYALLREVLKKTDKVGIARVVIQTKQHLAMLVPSGPVLVLNLLRWSDEIRSIEDLTLPDEGTSGVGLTAKELQMGEQLVDDMTSEFTPDDFTDEFKAQVLKLVDAKVKAGDTAAATVLEPTEQAEAGATVYDLTELLKRSIGSASSQKRPARKAPKDDATEDKPVKAARKTPAKRKAA